MNPRGMLTPGKVLSLQKLAATQHLDVLALTETHLTEHNLDLVNEVTGTRCLIIIPSPLCQHCQQGKGGIALMIKEHKNDQPLQRCPRPTPGPLTPGPRPPPRTSLVCSIAARCASKSRVLLQNPMGSAGVGNTTTLPAVRALPDNCSCVHLICCHRPASPSPVWLQPP